MLNRHELLDWTAERFDQRRLNHYSRKSLDEMIATGAIVEVQQNLPLIEILHDYIPLTRNDRGGKTILLPKSYQIPFTNSNTTIKDVTENGYHGLHLPRFVQRAVRAIAEERQDQYLKDWASRQKTITQEIVRETGLRPKDITEYALSYADPLPERGTGIPRVRQEAIEPRPKIGRGYMNLRNEHQFILFPYVNIIDGFRILARSEMEELPNFAKVSVNLSNKDDRQLLKGEVSRSPKSKGGRSSYKSIISIPKKPYDSLTPWLMTANCNCEDFRWRSDKNTRMAHPTIKFCKHLVATVLKAGMVTYFPNDLLPSPMGTSLGFALRRAYELETRVLIEQDDGSVRGLNKTEESWWLGATEQWLIQKNQKKPDIMFSHGLAYRGKNGYLPLKEIERELILSGPPAYLR